MKERVLVAMSGGVDSSVAAALLVRDGYDVVGATMKLFSDGEDLPDRPCCSLDSVNDARRVCEQLGIPHYVLNLTSRFNRDVIDEFVSEYARGRTPIPCVRCNSFTKFRDFADRADLMDAKYVATGHYAHAEKGALYRGMDHEKDQTYFLWGIPRSVLSRMILPLGRYTKPQIRRIASELELPVAEKPESQEICFVPDGDYVSIIRKRLGDDSAPLSRGPFVTTGGEHVGWHDGYARYTVGQRKRLPGGSGEPMYVVAIRPHDRAVVIGTRDELSAHEVVATGLNWLAASPCVGTRVSVRIRHRAPLLDAAVAEISNDQLTLTLRSQALAVTPGQSLVLYDHTARVLGGGVIERASRDATRAGMRATGSAAFPATIP